MSVKASDSSIREAVIATIREYRRSLKRLMSVQHRASKPFREEPTYCDGCKRLSRGPICPYC